MKKTLLYIFVCMCAIGAHAQTLDSLSRREQLRLQTIDLNLRTQETLKEWDKEYRIDSLDQEKLPKVVNGGVMLGSNISNFFVTRDQETFSSFMRVGAELGGFVDFTVTKHFLIEGQLLWMAEQNKFEDGTSSMNLWSFGLEIPVYFMGRYGSMDKGYLLFGGGPFTHFTFASNIKNHYSNNAADLVVTDEWEEVKFKDSYKLHDNHSGLAAMVGYELPFGLQIAMSYKVSLSDILTFYKNNADTEAANAAIYPQHVSLTIGYHWR